MTEYIKKINEMSIEGKESRCHASLLLPLPVCNNAIMLACYCQLFGDMETSFISPLSPALWPYFENIKETASLISSSLASVWVSNTPEAYPCHTS